MRTYLRDKILTSAALGLLGLAVCTTGASAQKPPPPCPPELQEAVKNLCEVYNIDKDDAQKLDYLALLNIDGTFLPVCGCPGVRICPPDDGCPTPLNRTGKEFLNQRAFYGATVRVGSTCEQWCSGVGGGAGAEYQDCIAACKG
jgi:hypothetical protein